MKKYLLCIAVASENFKNRLTGHFLLNGIFVHPNVTMHLKYKYTIFSFMNTNVKDGLALSI